MKNVFVIDTNVFVVASCETHYLALTCLEFLERIFEEEHTILIDDFYDQKSKNYISEIANEYSSNLSSQDAAFWILQKIRSYEPDGIIKRVVVKKDKNNKYYLNFPRDQKLKKFDKSDRKFVTVAILSNLDPEIVNAVDTDWKTFETILKKYVRLKFL